MGALCAAFAACDEPAPTVPPVQTCPQEPVINVNAVSGDAVGKFAAGEIIDLQSYADAGSVEMFTYAVTDSLSEGVTMSFACEVSADENFGNRFAVPVECKDGKGYASVEGIDNAVVAIYGIARDPRALYYRVIPYITVGGTNYRLGTDYMVSGKFDAVCLAKWANYVSPAYYFLGDATTWDLGEAVKYAMTRQGDIFVYNFEVKAGQNVYWKIAPEFAITYNSWTTVLGFSQDGAEVKKGVMEYGGNGAGVVHEEGFYKVTFNPATREVEMTLLPGFLYTPGDANGWTFDNCQLVYYNEGKKANIGAIVASGSFKITKSNNWDTDWGANKDVPGTLALKGANIEVAEAGLQWLVADIENLTYSLSHVTSVGLVGAFNGWSETAPFELTPNEDGSVWTGKTALSGDWKVVLNHSWDSNYGGKINDLVTDGDNISGYDGEYTVTIDFSGKAPVMSIK